MRYYKVHYTIKGSHGFIHNKKLGVVTPDLLSAAIIVEKMEPSANILNIVYGGIVHVYEKNKQTR